MSDPIWMPPDKSYHLTSLFEDGRLYCPPRKEIVDAFLTIIARASKDYDVGIVAWSLMGSHPHVQLFDRDPTKPTQIPAFEQFVNGVFARWLNDYWDLEGKVFDGNVVPQTIAVVDVSREIETLTYIETNPIEAGLVWDTAELNGATSQRSYLLEPLEIPRPTRWFRKQRWPDVATLQLEVPPEARAAGYSRIDWWVKTSSEVALETTRLTNMHRKNGNSPVGMDQLVKADPYTPRKRRVSYRRVPFTGNDQAALARAYLKRRQFLRSYRKAMEQVKAGESDVTFPYGTSRMVTTYGHQMHAKVTARAG